MWEFIFDCPQTQIKRIAQAKGGAARARTTILDLQPVTRRGDERTGGFGGGERSERGDIDIDIDIAQP